jgi:hypothetical protein
MSAVVVTQRDCVSESFKFYSVRSRNLGNVARGLLAVQVVDFFSVGVSEVLAHPSLW